MFWFDTHFHIGPEKVPEAASILANAQAAGVTGLIVQGTSLEDCEPTLALTNGRDGVYATCGLHPHVADTPYEMDYFRGLFQNPKAVAVGEIGLDYYYDFSARDNQRRMFAEFLRLAVELDKPVVIHSREAFEDTWAIVNDCLPPDHPFEIHSFTGTLEEGEKWLERGAMMSINGMITFKKSDNVRAFNKIVPDDRLLLETDSPYLAPVPYRGKENTPSLIPVIAQYVANERGVTLEELSETTNANTMRFFRIREMPAQTGDNSQ